MLKRYPFLLFLISALAFDGFGQSATVTLRPSHVDLSSITSYSAVLMTLSSYSSNSVKYRLFNGANQYYPWDGSAFVTSGVYSLGPSVPGTPTSNLTFWIIYQRGSNNSITASYRDRLGPTYFVNYQTVVLPTATEIASPFNLNGTFTAAPGYELDQLYVVLGYDALVGGTLLCATSTVLTTGAYSLVCNGGHNIKRLEVRNVANTLLKSLTNETGWSTTYEIGETPLPVELTSFTARAVGNVVNLNWETKTEIDNLGFEVERKDKSGTWMKTAFVEGHGTSNSPKYYNFEDKKIASGKHSYRLKQIDNDGSFEYSNEVEITIELPTEFAMSQNYPNPFNPSTKVDYQLAENARVTIELYGMTGERVALLVSEQQEAGYYSMMIDAYRHQLASGIYLYRMIATDALGKNFVATKKLSLIK